MAEKLKCDQTQIMETISTQLGRQAGGWVRLKYRSQFYNLEIFYLNKVHIRLW